MSQRYDEEYARRERTGQPGQGDPYRDPARNPYPGPPSNAPGYTGPGYETRRTSYSAVTVAPYNVRLVRTIWFITGLIDALLLIRFVLRLLGASIQADFVRFIYGITDPLI